MLRMFRPIAFPLVGLLAFAPPAAATSASHLIELTALADELTFDIQNNRDLMLESCSASSWCRVYGQELIDAIEGSGSTLRLGPLAVEAIDEMLEQLDPEARQALFDFYESDLGRRIVEIEVESRTPAFFERLEAEGAEYYASIADEEERYNLTETIDSETDRSAVARLLDRTASRVVDFVAQRARERGESEQPVLLEMKPRNRHEYHLRLAFSLRSLPTEDVEAFIEFLESDAGQNWSQTHREIRMRAAKQAATPVMAKLIAELGAGEPTQ